MEIDNRQCYQQSEECFQSATDVAAFLGALASSGNLNVPYIIEAVTSECLYDALKEHLLIQEQYLYKPVSLFLIKFVSR